MFSVTVTETLDMPRHGRAKPSTPRTDPLPAPPRVLLDERGCAYRVVRSDKAAGPDGDERLVFSVEVIGFRAPELAAAYGLTPRQAHIAHLLARRATNAEIAVELQISRHTARHHTEQVLTKLGVRSRAAVRQLIFAPQK